MADSKPLRLYRDSIRALREAGSDSFSAANGYKLSGPISSGQKAAITRAMRSIQDERGIEFERVSEDDLEFEFDDAALEAEESFDYEYGYDELDYLIDEFAEYDLDEDDTGGSESGS